MTHRSPTPNFKSLLIDTLISSTRAASESADSDAGARAWRESGAAKGSRAGAPTRQFWVSDFFRKWFREDGAAYFFLFRKNLKVTNIQFAELLSLIRTHTRLKGRNEIFHDLQFLSAPEFRDALKEVVDSFPAQPGRIGKERYELIAELYSSILERQVVIESLYGSCAVYVPPHLEIDIRSICAYSGYIHSCGRIVFIRNINKAAKDEFMDAVRNYLDKHHPRKLGSSASKDKLFFTVYSHEDFSKHDRSKQEYLRHGLEDVKLYVEKFYMDAQRLVDVLKQMQRQRRFKDRLYIQDRSQDAGAREEQREEQRRQSTIWLLVDNSIGQEMKARGDDRYYVCYEQQYMNDNAFYVFDENKPAWLAPTTIPHTLVAAMLNLAEMPHAGSITLADPFVGTGTTWLEALKFYHLKSSDKDDKKIKLRCSDLADIAPLLAADNLGFFSPAEERFSFDEEEKLQYLIDILNVEKIRENIYIQARKRGEAAKKDVEAYLWAERYLRALDRKLRAEKRESDYSYALNEERTIELFRAQPRRRLLFYILLRTSLLNLAAFKRKGETDRRDFDAFQEQARKLSRQIELLKTLRKRESNPGLSESQRKAHHVPGFKVFKGGYSLAYSIDFDELKDIKARADAALKVKAEGGKGATDWTLIQKYDVMTPLPRGGTSERALDQHTLKPDSCDVIITDPPYGFNTDDDPKSLAELYAEALTKMIGALKDNGQLVLCLLDRSHTGRRSPFFTHKELIIQQVLSIADKMGREVIIPAFAVPHQREIFRAPYYWESERALRRAILHFKFRSRQSAAQ